jgi:hypothetical protein
MKGPAGVMLSRRWGGDVGQCGRSRLGGGTLCGRCSSRADVACSCEERVYSQRGACDRLLDGKGDRPSKVTVSVTVTDLTAGNQLQIAKVRSRRLCTGGSTLYRSRQGGLSRRRRGRGSRYGLRSGVVSSNRLGSDGSS